MRNNLHSHTIRVAYAILYKTTNLGNIRCSFEEKKKLSENHQGRVTGVVKLFARLKYLVHFSYDSLNMHSTCTCILVFLFSEYFCCAIC